ncbi:MAG: ankyrin repeat domain-containing protein [Acetobacter sp.]|nr:ankyrin repeat domain-containing protein [Acetobacter sp.]
MTEQMVQEQDLKEQLRIAIMMGNVDEVKALIADMSVEELNTPRSKGKKETMLMVAVYSGNLEMVDLLLAKGADVNVSGGRGDTVFDMLPMQGDKRLVMAKKLIDAGAEQVPEEFAGRTDLMWAISLKDKDEVQRLIATGVDLDAKDASDRFVWEYALVCEDKEILQTLVASGMDVNNTFNAAGKNFLMQALYLGNNETAKFLLENGANVNVETQTGVCAGYTPLFFAQNPEIIQLMVEMGADVNHCAKDGRVPMMGKNAAEMEVFINAGADVRITDSRVGMNYMSNAALRNNIEVVKLLQRAGLDINAKDENGWSPLMYAVASKEQVGAIRQTPPYIIKPCQPSVEVIQQMIDNGAEVTSEVLAIAEENDDIRKVLEKAQEDGRQGLKDEMKKQTVVSGYFQEKKVREAEILMATSAAASNTSDRASGQTIDIQFMKKQNERQV